MHNFVLKNLSSAKFEDELKIIGFDKSYLHRAQDKYHYRNIKIYNLTSAQANILKQSALSVGADCATHRDVITGKAQFSDAILGASVSQLYKIAEKLKSQPFGLKELSQSIINSLEIKYPPKTSIMGVLNLTTNSFSDGGMYYEYENAISQLNKLIDDGADIIDIGAESTKPFSHHVDAKFQLEKLIPILEYIKNNNIKTPISIDTRSSQVAQECIKYGVSIINDVSGFDFDKSMTDVISQNPNVKVILQHSQGTPETMQISPTYNNLIDEIYLNLRNKVEFAISKGIQKSNIIIDPGIGFGKSREDNFEILKRWKEFKTIGCPVLIGVSRKSLLNMDGASNEEKDLYTLSLNSPLILDKIDIIRVHNVKIHKTFQNLIG